MLTDNPTFLDDLIRTVEFKKRTNLVPTNAAGSAETSPLNSGSTEIDGVEYDFGELCIDQVKGWQKMTCHKCSHIYLEPPNPVKLSMICPGCGDVIQNEGVF